MSVNRNASTQPADHTINIHVSGNAHLNWAYADHGSNSKAGHGVLPESGKPPIWKQSIFWTAIAAIAGVISAIAAFR